MTGLAGPAEAASPLGHELPSETQHLDAPRLPALQFPWYPVR
jgi:hypothetical protein